MKNDIKLNPQVSKFIGTFSLTFFAVLGIHVVALLILSFINWDVSLVVSGLDASEATPIGRTLILIPYLVLPTLTATLSVAGCGLTKMRNTLKRIKKLRGEIAARTSK